MFEIPMLKNNFKPLYIMQNQDYLSQGHQYNLLTRCIFNKNNQENLLCIDGNITNFDISVIHGIDINHDIEYKTIVHDQEIHSAAMILFQNFKNSEFSLFYNQDQNNLFLINYHQRPTIPLNKNEINKKLASLKKLATEELSKYDSVNLESL